MLDLTTRPPIHPPTAFTGDYFEGDKSLIHLLPFDLRMRMEANRYELLELLKRDEVDIRREVKPSTQLNRLRTRFWCEVEKAQDTGREITFPAFCSGITTKSGAMKELSVLGNLVWFLKPVIPHDLLVQEAHSTALSKMRHFLDYDVMAEGKPNVRALSLMVNIYKLLDARLYGEPTKNVNKNIRSLNLHAKAREMDANLDTMSDSELQSELLRVRQQSVAATFSPVLRSDEEEIIPEEEQNG